MLTATNRRRSPQFCRQYVPTVRIDKPAYSEPVLYPRNRKGGGRNGIRHTSILGCGAGLTLALTCVAAVGQLVAYSET